MFTTVQLSSIRVTTSFVTKHETWLCYRIMSIASAICRCYARVCWLFLCLLNSWLYQRGYSSDGQLYWWYWSVI